MTEIMDEFQVFAKPVSYQCNLHCSYCYYLTKSELFGSDNRLTMSADILERYIGQHIEACSNDTVQFSWHGGEPTLAGLEYYHLIVELQEKHCPQGKQICNGIQTNGTLLNDEWARFLAEHRFSVGLSLDGFREAHDCYRLRKDRSGTFDATIQGYENLKKHGLEPDILCVVHDFNVMYPLQVYRFFKEIGVRHLSFLPLVERLADSSSDVTERSVHPEAFGGFLCTIFNEWASGDIGSIKIQIFEEALRCAFGQEHSLCLFRPTCGQIPVIEYSGNVYTCDHFVEPEYYLGNIKEKTISEILKSKELGSFGRQKRLSLSKKCRACDVLEMCNGGCLKNRFITIAGEPAPLNYLCPGYLLFFRHCLPFAQAVAEQWQKQTSSQKN